ncbi:MAG TPA: hypothetical protein PKI32_03755 [Opitutales bacterium]|nr:hypothetical protein [Opitutales bacterium]
MRTLMSVAFGVCAAAHAVAHDADTIAFYPFADGTAGASAVGDTVTNAIGSVFGMETWREYYDRTLKLRKRYGEKAGR